MKVSSTTNQHHWLDIAEKAAIFSSIGGSITGVFFKQFLWATIPLSAAAGLALINHQRLKNLINQEQQTITSLMAMTEGKINDLKAEYSQNYHANKTNFTELEEELGQVRNLAITELARLQQESKAELSATTQEMQLLQASLTKLDSLSQKLESDLHAVDQKQKETGKLVRELKAIDIFTQNIKAAINPIQSYFERGFAYQRLGNKHRAIDDYTRTLELDSNHAQAYHNRGLLYAEMSMDQKAVIDLRRASQLFFDKGNLDKYRETRDLSQKIQQNQPAEVVNNKEQDSEPVIVSNLFG
ncbi:MAG: tetratricopeptide repeat protein [Cyanobacteria bacterium P01_A01_bin.40]